MAAKARARDVVRWKTEEHAWLDHAVLTDDDLGWIGRARQLTLWAVTMPDGWLARHPSLVGLDLRGGSGNSADLVRGCTGLRYLVLNQIRGLSDLSAVAGLESLELLDLYGLPQVTSLPSLRGLTRLERLQVGSMKGLTSLAPALEAPALRELQLYRAVAMAPDDPERIRLHPTLRKFDWFGEDVPLHRWVPVLEAVGKPKPRPMLVEDWFAERDRAD